MRARRGLPGRRALTGAAVVVMVLGGGVTAWAATGSEPAGYRTAAVTIDDVTETLSGTGTVTPRDQEDLTFGTSGTVAAVTVAVGDRVTSGQVVARLSKADLRAALLDARASLAQAKATLARDRTSQTTSATTTTTSTEAYTSVEAVADESATRTTTRAARALARKVEDLTNLQDALLAAQHTADQAIATATAALDQQSTACAPAVDGITDVAGCRAALDTVQAAQTATGAAQHDVKKAIDELTRALIAAVQEAQSGSSGSSGSSGPPSSPTPTPSGSPSTPTDRGQTPSTGQPSSSTPSSGGVTVTAATLARDQAQVDAARAALLRAKQDLAAADLVSPLDGTVTAVSAATGDRVSAGSGPQVVVVGDGGDVAVSLTIPERRIRSVRTGDQARVTPDGGTSSVPGTVTAIGLLSASTDGTAAYPVTVRVADAPAALASGASAFVAVEIGTADDVVTVPTSALSTTGDGASATVRVLGADGSVEQTRIQLGARGSLRSEVTSGLKAGQQVVLADLSQPLPSGGSDNQPLGRFTGDGPPGGFTGGGPPGGFTGGAPNVDR